MPLPELFSGLPVTTLTAVVAFGTLVVVGILSASTRLAAPPGSNRWKH